MDHSSYTPTDSSTHPVSKFGLGKTGIHIDKSLVEFVASFPFDRCMSCSTASSNDEYLCPVSRCSTLDHNAAGIRICSNLLR